MTEIKSTIAAMLQQMPNLNKCRRDFFTKTMLLFLSIRGRINFLQLARHTDKYVESTFRNNFEEEFDFCSLNRRLVDAYGSGHNILAFDPSYISKSGKHTPGTGKWWSGCAGRAEWGMELGALCAIDIDQHTAYHLDSVVSPSKEERELKEISLTDHYAQVIEWNWEKIAGLSAYLVVDAYFSKREFIGRMSGLGLHVVSLLRSDANLSYLYNGPRRAGKGAPKKYDGKVDTKAIDLSKCKTSYEDESVVIYDSVVHCKFLKQKIRLAYTVWKSKEGKENIQLYFSTDLSLPAFMIVKYYTARFQQEFVFRDAKQFTGLNQCQSRSEHKIDFHWNMALSAVNFAKVQHIQSLKKGEKKPFSMASLKTRLANELILERFIAILPPESEFTINHPRVRELCHWGCIAA